MKHERKGKFIVIDGIDSSGKTTQADIIKNYIKQLGFKCKIVSFPQYDQKSSGLVENYLEGKYGDLNEVSAYQASIFYAVDRFDAKKKIETLLNKGFVVIANRYVSANMAHQGSKLDSVLHRQTFYEWIRNFEYKIFNIPKPDLTLFLNVETEIVQALMKKRKRHDWINKSDDIHEKNYDYLKATENTYREIARLYNEVKIIECTENSQMLSIDEVSRRIWKEISPLFKLKDKNFPSKQFFCTDIFEYPPQKTDNIKFKPLNKLYTEPKLNNDKKSYIIFAADYHTLCPGETEFITAGLSIDLPDDKFAWVVDIHQRPQQIISSGTNNEILIEVINRDHDDMHISPQQIIGYLYIFKNK